MRDMKFMRGQIWWMEGYEVHKEGARKRPALIISNELINNNMANNSITVIPITSNVDRADIKTNVLFDRHTRAKNIIKCGDIVTIYKDQLVSYESTLDDEAMEKVEEALKFALGLEKETNTTQDFSKVEFPILMLDDELPEDLTKKSDENEKIEYEIEKTNKRIKWTAENEALFMRMYTEYGVDATAEKFQMNKASATQRAYVLRKKYPDFNIVKE